MAIIASPAGADGAMTSPAGYRRLQSSVQTLQADMWAWMRRRRNPWTCAELAAAAGASQRLARRYVARLAAAGYLAGMGEEPAANGQIPARLWSLARDTGPIEPVLVGGAAGDGVLDLNSDMSGPQLAALRRTAGLTLAEFAEQALGIRDRRTARRYETAQIVPAPAAARARAFAKAHGLPIGRAAMRTGTRGLDKLAGGIEPLD